MPCSTKREKALFTKYEDNPVLRVGPVGAFDQIQAFPGAIWFENETFYLFYNGMSAEHTDRPGGGVMRIGVATSTDLKNWTKYENNPILDIGPEGAWDEWQVFGLGILHLKNGTWALYYAAFGSPGRWRGVGLATSDSPYGPFTKYNANPVMELGASGEFDSYAIHQHMVIERPDGTFAMMYTGNDTKADRGGLATSTDLVHWFKDPNNPVFPLGPSGSWDANYVRPKSLIKVGDVYLMFYEGVDYVKGRKPLEYVDRTGLAKSTDLITWERHPRNPVIKEGAGRDAWDTLAAIWPAAILHGLGADAKIYVLYASANPGTPLETGLAWVDLKDLEDWLP